jgi:hypothetical protein
MATADFRRNVAYETLTSRTSAVQVEGIKNAPTKETTTSSVGNCESTTMLRIRENPHMPTLCAASRIWERTSWQRTWRALTELLRDPYRPEQHYMRGPGPKYRAKHRR